MHAIRNEISRRIIQAGRHGGLTVDVFNSLDNVDAWDFERIDIVARWSFQVGYLSEDDTYAWLNVADQLTRADIFRERNIVGPSCLAGLFGILELSIGLSAKMAELMPFNGHLEVRLTQSNFGSDSRLADQFFFLCYF